jgi:hypothetical protein
MNDFYYQDPPEQVAAAIKEQHRAGAKLSQGNLADLKKADAEKRAALMDVNSKYPAGVPSNARVAYDAVNGSDNSITAIEEALLLWDSLSAQAVCDELGRWPTDPNRAMVVDNNLTYAFGLSAKAGAIRENIKRLYSILEEEKERDAAAGDSPGTWTLPASPLPERRERLSFGPSIRL